MYWELSITVQINDYFMYILSILIQATPRLTEDTVKQCVDPRLKGEYPPKGVAKVCLNSYYLSFVCACFHMLVTAICQYEQ